ncbi:MAG: hypothetical protein Q8S73_23375 [Deltaproteobacteria bacterium]|nr:hypothetical protein [Myxococcales bacterium]MDP3217072.1 hypothetical protein [Deltaproteobacteria bacterium]
MSAQVLHEEGDLGAVRVGLLEEADQVARLLLVEGDGLGAPTTGEHLRRPLLEEDVEDAGQGRRARGRVIGISGVALPLAGDVLGGLLVEGPGRALVGDTIGVVPLRVVGADGAVVCVAAAEEAHGNLSFT